MYCMNCGKEISGNIPICGECLQSVLDKHRAEQDILTRVNLEAQPFSIKEVEEEPVVEELTIEPETETLSEESIKFHGEASENTQKKDEDDNNDIWITFAIVMAIVSFLVICVALAKV